MKSNKGNNSKDVKAKNTMPIQGSKKNLKDKKNSNGSKLLYVALLVIAVNGVIFTYNNVKDKKNTGSDYSIATTNGAGDVVLKKEDITKNATFLTVDVDGTDVGLFAVLAEDGSIRTALDTCQVCNGSPKAYFTQSGDKFMCNNCGNKFHVNQIEQASGGCNPVPITMDIKEETENEVIIPYEYIKEQAIYFKNWKKS